MRCKRAYRELKTFGFSAARAIEILIAARRKDKLAIIVLRLAFASRKPVRYRNAITQ